MGRQGTGDSLDDAGDNVRWSPETDFFFCRVDIDIDEGRLYFQIQVQSGMEAGGETTEAVADGATDKLVVDRAMVEENELSLFVASCFREWQEIAGSGDACTDGFRDGDQGIRRAVVCQGCDACLQIVRTGEVENCLTVLAEDEPDFREREGVQAELVFDMG